MSRRNSRKASDAVSFQSDDFDYETVVETRQQIRVDHCGYLRVFIQGNLEEVMETTPVFLTVHDLGANHTEYHKFVEHPSMARLKGRSVWVHIDLPGQENDAEDLPAHFQFPTLEKISQDILQVMDALKLKYVITFGDGAGANILLRFAMNYPDRVLGNILVHASVGVESVKSFFSDRIMNWKLSTFGMNSAADQYLVYHKFGMYLDSKKDLDHENHIKRYLERLHKRINPKNLRLYVESYMKRNDISNMLRENLKSDTLIVSGSYEILVQHADEIQALADPKHGTRVKINHCGSVLSETPEIFAYHFLLFCQGLGYFSSMPISRSGSICVSNSPRMSVQY